MKVQYTAPVADINSKKNMSRKILLAAVLCTGYVFSMQSAVAAVVCTETVTEVTLSEHGSQVLFISSPSCPESSWCQATAATDTSLSRQYALLLIASGELRPVKMYWPNLSSCGQANAVNGTPLYMLLQQ